MFIYLSWMFVTVFGNFQQVYLYFERSILFGNLSQQWDDDLVGVQNPTTPKRKVFALIPNTPGAHSICVHCAAKDPTRGLAAGYVSYVSSCFFGVVWGRGVGVVVSWNICSDL